MISTVSMKTFILTLGLTLLIFFIGVSLFFYLSLYRPNSYLSFYRPKAIKAPTISISSVKKILESTSPPILMLGLTQVIFFIGVSSSFYLFLYRPKVNKAVKATKTISSVRENFEKAIKETREIQEEIDRLSRDRFHRSHPNSLVKPHPQRAKGPISQ